MDKKTRYIVTVVLDSEMTGPEVESWVRVGLHNLFLARIQSVEAVPEKAEEHV